MDGRTVENEVAFDGYVGALIGAIRQADRTGPLRDHYLGLMLPVERKSAEPLAAVTAPSRLSAWHHLQPHLVGQAGQSHEAIPGWVRDWVLPHIERDGPIRAWIIDNTGFPAKGKHSVGVCAAVLRSVGQAGQLSSGREPAGGR